MGIVFLQAEDGIRDLVRSRGLGDVYKRQGQRGREVGGQRERPPEGQAEDAVPARFETFEALPVSYTHLTLPTSDLV